MSENTNERRLPPPAFPPGHRRYVARNNVHPEGAAAPADARGEAPASEPSMIARPLPTTWRA
jgi:hypothetical protein